MNKSELELAQANGVYIGKTEGIIALWFAVTKFSGRNYTVFTADHKKNVKKWCKDNKIRINN